jgi:hypothetical protein
MNGRGQVDIFALMSMLDRAGIKYNYSADKFEDSGGYISFGSGSRPKLYLDPEEGGYGVEFYFNEDGSLKEVENIY